MLKLGAPPKVTGRCPIRLPEMPANDTYHRHIFKTPTQYSAGARIQYKSRLSDWSVGAPAHNQ